MKKGGKSFLIILVFLSTFIYTLNINKNILIMKTPNIIKTNHTSQEVKHISSNSELLHLFQVEELEQRYEMGWGGGGNVSFPKK